MSRRFVFALLAAMLISLCTTVLAYDSGELQRRLVSCTPTKNFNAGGTTLYQITGITGSLCIYKIEHIISNNEPNLICKVPFAKMREAASPNPLTSQRIKRHYCVMSFKSPENKTRSAYYYK